GDLLAVSNKIDGCRLALERDVEWGAAVAMLSDVGDELRELAGIHHLRVPETEADREHAVEARRTPERAPVRPRARNPDRDARPLDRRRRELRADAVVPALECVRLAGQQAAQ